MTLVAPCIALFRREIWHFVRRPSHVIAALATPALVWLLLGSGFSGSLAMGTAPDGASPQDYRAFLIPGTAILVCVFSSIVSAMSLIDDKKSTWMRHVMLSPVPRGAIALARVLAAVLLGAIQATLVLAIAPVAGIGATATGYLGALLCLMLTSALASGFSLAMAWMIGTSRGFHGVVNLVLLPAWLLSGAMFPLDGASGWIRAAAIINPLAWAHLSVQGALQNQWQDVYLPLTGLAVLAVLSIGVAGKVIGKQRDTRS